ncbi:hypothetical protein ASG90_03780 [Nocardioides sp. Soil797]|nr:hypothetical protein ASG90_03780 [Nocardioides sp. Soil797]
MARPLPRGPGLLLRWVVAGVVCVLAVLGPAGPASAHASLVGSDPAEGAVLVAAPQQATLTFDEPVTLPEDAVQVFDAQGHPVASDSTARDKDVAVDLPDGLSDGTYVVTWGVVSGDGHPVSGSLTFSIGKPSEDVVTPGSARPTASAVSAALGIAQAVTYLTLFLAGGLLLFASVLLPADAGAARARRRTVGVARCATVLAVLGAVLVVPLTALHQQYLRLGDIATSAAWDLHLIRDDLAVAALVTVGLVVASTVTSWSGPPWDALSRGARLGRTAIILAGAVIAVTAPTLVGHPRQTAPVPLVLATDALHLVTGAIWVGGLVGLALSLGSLRRHADVAGHALSRFSIVAAATLALLVATGSFMAWRIVGSWEALFGTRYGTLLLVKIGIALLTVAVAGLNRFVLLPRSLAEDGRFVAVRRAVTAEAALLVGVLMVTGFLVAQSPNPGAGAAEPVAQPEFVSTEVGDLEVLVLLTPQGTGPNTLHVHVEDASGRPVRPYADPVVAMHSDDVDLGPVPLEASGKGVFTARVVIPEPGDWQVQVSLRLDEFENPVTTLTVPVPAG